MGILPHLQQMGFIYFVITARRFNRKEPFNRVLSQRKILNFILDCLASCNKWHVFVTSRCFGFRGFIYSLYYCCCCCWFYVYHFFFVFFFLFCFVGLSQKPIAQLHRNAATMVFGFSSI